MFAADQFAAVYVHVCSRMLSGVEAGLNQAMEKLPENVAQKVQGRFLNRYDRGKAGCCSRQAGQGAGGRMLESVCIKL